MTTPAGRPPRHALMDLMRAVARGDVATALRLLVASPALAKARLADGAMRQTAQAYYLDEIEHYLYAGDTPLHVAAAAYQGKIARELIAAGADVRARNRLGGAGKPRCTICRDWLPCQDAQRIAWRAGATSAGGRTRDLAEHESLARGSTPAADRRSTQKADSPDAR